MRYAEMVIAKMFHEVATEFNIPQAEVITWVRNNCPPGKHSFHRGIELVNAFREDCQAGKVPSVTLDEGT